jgi:hypothetical protein
MAARIRAVLPARWFPVSPARGPSATPVLDGVLAGLGGTHAQTLIPVSTTIDAPAGSTALSLTSADALVVGMPVRGADIAWNATVTAISGDTVTISPGTLGDVPEGSGITFVLNTYYLRDYTAQNGTWLLITGKRHGKFRQHSWT